MSYVGLSTTEAEKRLREDGFNEVKSPEFNFYSAVFSRLWEPTAWILEAALVIEVMLGKHIQSLFILLMLLFSAINGAIQNGRASHVLQSLTNKLELDVSVKRSGKWKQVPGKQLVVGDLINLEPGTVVAADVEILKTEIEVDESSITGESIEIVKKQGNTVYAGTVVLSGSTEAKVSATGVKSRSGKTVSLANTASAPGRLQKLLGRVIGYLAILDTILAIILVGAALINGEDLISLAPFIAMLFIATIPIAMPSSFSVANSVEASELSNRKILVSDLSGIQESANLDLLLIDKTGTITNGQSKVVKFVNYSNNFTDEQVRILAKLATNTKRPTMIDRAIQSDVKDNEDKYSSSGYKPFSSSIGYSNVVVTDNKGNQSWNVKLGSLKILNHSKIDFGLEFLKQGRSVAVSIVDNLCGIFIVDDTPRETSKDALHELKLRGIKTVMLTGDNVGTAQNIANKVAMEGKVVSFQAVNHLEDVNSIVGIADVLPENKLEIVEYFQRLGYVVGMTGDGINDAPALSQADVGIAVKNAVDLAKKSAKIILMRDGLSPIIDVLDSGHRVYQRMMTWTITKLARTAELTLLLTIGYLFFNQIPLSLNALVLVAILNDLVTLVLGTDNTKITHHPESWNIGKLCRVAAIFTIGWTVIGFALLFKLAPNSSVGQLSTTLYVYLIFSAMMTILMTRTTGFWWKSKPSMAVMSAIIINCVLTVFLSIAGIGLVKISISTIIQILLLVLICSIVLDGLQTIFYRKQGESNS